MVKTQSSFLEFLRHVASGQIDQVLRGLKANPSFATIASDVGATRREASRYFLSEIGHYVYAGDTALHMAAAGARLAVAELLVGRGADCRAQNRRGAQPLHYAADASHSDPSQQAEMIRYLLSLGADPNALNVDGVSPLHKAVRTRSCTAVQAMLDGGADPRAPNKSGSTPLHLAVQPTGRGGSGSQRARQQQAEIIKLLLHRGARVSDKDGNGRRVDHAAKSEWIHRLIQQAKD